MDLSEKNLSKYFEVFVFSGTTQTYKCFDYSYCRLDAVDETIASFHTDFPHLTIDSVLCRVIYHYETKI